jgi:hypothetical protein
MGLIKCSECQGMISDKAVTCPHCGAPVEEILADVAANLFRGIEAVGGRLKITNRRILFEPHFFNVQKMPVEIRLDDISAVGKRDTYFLVPNGMLIRTKAGEEYKFVLWGREKIISIIESIIPRT